MTFRHLEDTLGDDSITPYLEFYEEIQEPTRTVFGYTLDIASHLNFHGLSDEYAVFGGYAVLSNLMESFGSDVAKVWRGSTDIDMGGNHDVLNSIRSGYHVLNDSPSPNLPDKRTLKLDTGGEKKCKIDFYLGDTSERYGTSRINSHFGIPLRVVKPEFIIRGKLETPRGEFQHYGDILGMLSVLEREGHTPERILEVLDHAQLEELGSRLYAAEHKFSKDRFGFFPGEKFYDKLKKEIHKRKPIGQH